MAVLALALDMSAALLCGGIFILYAYSISISDKVSRLVDMATPLSLDADCTLEWSSVSLWVLVYPMTSTSSETNHSKNTPTFVIVTAYKNHFYISFIAFTSVFLIKKTNTSTAFLLINYVAQSRTSYFVKNLC